MKISQIIDFINKVEMEFPVNEWTINGIHIWPLIRIQVAYNIAVENIFNNIEEKNSKTNNEDELMDREDEINQSKYWLDEQTDVIFLSLTDTSREFIDGILYDRLCDPLIEEFHRINHSSLILNYSLKYDNRFPTNSASVNIREHIDNIVSCIHSENSFKYELNEFDKFNSMLKEFYRLNDLNIPILDVKTLKNQAIKIREIANYFKVIFSKTKPSLGFIVCYYDLIGMAFNLACREVGITSVDIQHGHQGDFHWAYSSWNNIPKDGYELLPSFFWCWGDEGVRTIKNWNKDHIQYHNVIKGGNPWIDMWKTTNSKLANYYNQQIANILPKQHDVVNILFTLQPLYGIEQWVIKAIENSPDSWYWWIRFHPRTEAKEKIEIENKINSLTSKNVEIKFATELPLLAWLNYIDVHVTGWSTCVIEAEAYDVSSVVIHMNGAEHYLAQIEKGLVIPAYKSNDLIEAIKLQLKKSKQLQNNVKIEISYMREAIKELLIVTCSEQKKYIDLDINKKYFKENYIDNKILLFEKYLYLLFIEKRYKEIIQNYKDFDIEQALFYVAKSYQAEKKLNSAIIYFIKYIEKLHSVDASNLKIQSNSHLLNIIQELSQMLVICQNITDYQKVLKIFKSNKYFRELYLRELYINKQYEKILEFKEYDSIEVNFYVGRSYKDLTNVIDATYYLNRYIEEVENGVNDENYFIRTQQFLVSAYFHLGEIYLELLDKTKATTCFEKCKEISEEKHLLAEEYLRRINE